MQADRSAGVLRASTANPPRQTSGSLESVGTKFRVPVPRDHAREIFGTLRAAYLIQLREPFLTRFTHRPYARSRENPTDVEEEATVLFADIQCAYALEPSGIVILAVRTN